MEPNQAKAQYEARLLALRGVVAVGCGTRKVKGVDTGQPCVAVLVKKKLPLASLATGEVVPAALEGVPTDVVEAGEVMALPSASMSGVRRADLLAPPFVGLRAPPTPALALDVEAHRERHRPLVGGISCGPTNFGLSGTVGLPLVYMADGSACLLSNTHVIAPYWYNQGMQPDWYEKHGIKVGAPIRQPSLADGGTPEDYVAQLLEWAEISPTAPNEMDAAIARLTVEASPELLGLGDALSAALSLTKGLTKGEYGQMAEPELGMVVRKSGRTSGVTEGKIAYTDLAIRVGYPFGEATFQGQVGIEPALLQPGDSGSAILGAGNVVLALGFAGSRVMSVATPIRRILERFGLRLTPPGTPVEVALASVQDRVRAVWGFDNRTKTWSLYDPGAPQASDLKVLRDGQGYWIEVSGDAVLTHQGRTWPLYQGWNLIGWKEEGK